MSRLLGFIREYGLIVLLWTVFYGFAWWNGYQDASDQGAREIAELQAKYEAERTKTALANLGALNEATERGNQLTRELITVKQENLKLMEEKKRALKTETTGRVCLDEPALRLLDGAPGLHVSDPARLTDRADAALTATDTDLATWAVDAGGQYAECVRRLDALIDWHTGGTP